MSVLEIIEAVTYFNKLFSSLMRV